MLRPCRTSAWTFIIAVCVIVSAVSSCSGGKSSGGAENWKISLRMHLSTVAPWSAAEGALLPWKGNGQRDVAQNIWKSTEKSWESIICSPNNFVGEQLLPLFRPRSRAYVDMCRNLQWHHPFLPVIAQYLVFYSHIMSRSCCYYNLLLHFTGRSILYMISYWQNQAVHPSVWPSVYLWCCALCHSGLVYGAKPLNVVPACF